MDSAGTWGWKSLGEEDRDEPDRPCVGGCCKGLDTTPESENAMTFLTNLGRANPTVGRLWFHPEAHTVWRAVANEPVDI